MYYLYRNGMYIVVESPALRDERIRQGWTLTTRDAFLSYWRERDREARLRMVEGTVR